MCDYEIVNLYTSEVVEVKAFLSGKKANDYAKSLGKNFIARRVSNRHA